MSLRAIRGLLIDLDGVLYIGRRTIPGALQAIKAIKARRFPYRFVTNTTRMGRKTIAQHLIGLGFPVTPSEIISPPSAAAQYIRQQGKSRYYLLANRYIQDAFMGLTETDDHPDFVVVGDLGRRFTFDALNRAFRLILAGADILALQKNRYWTTETGPVLDAGSFVAALEYATGKRAVVVGKPEQAFFELALAELNLRPFQVAMVGDNLDSDVGGAQQAGLQGVLVRTGNYRPEHLTESTVKPDLIIDSIAALPVHLP
ncbi:MAG: TIGR01458 family HAD-type hydrolase [Candidatus Latescibacteria bacterium]|nr:TIGR01458 family HAD-type hydrolase [Candidatus Latescibacterota bacterium]